MHALVFCRKANKQPIASADIEAFDTIPLPLMAYASVAVGHYPIARRHFCDATFAVMCGLGRVSVRRICAPEFLCGGVQTVLRSTAEESYRVGTVEIAKLDVGGRAQPHPRERKVGIRVLSAFWYSCSAHRLKERDRSWIIISRCPDKASTPVLSSRPPTMRPMRIPSSPMIRVLNRTIEVYNTSSSAA